MSKRADNYAAVDDILETLAIWLCKLGAAELGIETTNILRALLRMRGLVVKCVRWLERVEQGSGVRQAEGRLADAVTALASVDAVLGGADPVDANVERTRGAGKLEEESG